MLLWEGSHATGCYWGGSHAIGEGSHAIMGGGPMMFWGGSHAVMGPQFLPPSQWGPNRGMGAEVEFWGGGEAHKGSPPLTNTLKSPPPPKFPAPPDPPTLSRQHLSYLQEIGTGWFGKVSGCGAERGFGGGSFWGGSNAIGGGPMLFSGGHMLLRGGPILLGGVPCY